MTALLAALAVMAGLGGLYWWRFMAPGAAPEAAAMAAYPTAVETAAVTRGTAVRKLKALGTLMSDNSVVLKPEVEGRVERILFEDGQRVAQGAPLLRLDDAVLRARLDEAEASLQLARRQFERAEELFARNAGTGRSRDEAFAALRADEARVRMLRASLAKVELKAPFAGVLGLRRVSVGDYLRPGQEVVNLEQLDPIKVEFQMPERFLGQLRAGQTVTLRSDAYPDRLFEAKVEAIDPRIDRGARSLRLRAIAANPDGLLRPGQFVTVTVRVDERRDALFVPEQALIAQGDKRLLFRVDGTAEAGRAALVEVRTGLRIAAQAEVLEGLAPGDTVVTAGHQKLRDGAPVRAVPPTFVAASPPDEEIAR
ncbi:MAG TPA: efflux RND transporter periplasmic adaptor subunit [Alphaproteobacteria bacterium]|nr:efflux RND transporter periplasmic adaptor subunit [Alphaproteobacteria bacterium]